MKVRLIVQASEVIMLSAIGVRVRPRQARNIAALVQAQNEYDRRRLQLQRDIIAEYSKLLVEE